MNRHDSTSDSYSSRQSDLHPAQIIADDMANRNAGNINRLIVTSGILHLWLYAKQSRNGFTRLRRWVKNHMVNVEMPQQRGSDAAPSSSASSTGQKSRLRRTLLGAAIGALLAMSMVYSKMSSWLICVSALLNSSC